MWRTKGKESDSLPFVLYRFLKGQEGGLLHFVTNDIIYLAVIKLGMLKSMGTRNDGDAGVVSHEGGLLHFVRIDGDAGVVSQ